MDNKYQVHIQMESVWEEETTIQLAEGVLYERSDSWFLRYKEPDAEQGAITATIKFTQDQIKLMRRGAVESDMTFERNVTHSGFYSTPLIHVELETVTTEIQVELTEGKGKLVWSYLLKSQADSSSLRRVIVLLS
ncbi:MAG: DUF1934 domain-containing protein [Paenibacillaceae bacterium]